KIGPGEQAAAVVTLGPPIGRVDVEQRFWPIVAGDELPIGQPLDDDAGEPAVDVLQHRAELCDVETASVAWLDSEVSTGHFPPEGSPLEVGEAGLPLQIRQGVGVLPNQALELGTRRDSELDGVHELDVVAL